MTLILSAAVLIPASIAFGDTFVVSNANNSLAGSLRQAIIEANINPGLDSIVFNIPGPGPHTIKPLSAFSFLAGPVIIDGFSQPGANPNTNPPGQGSNAVLQIELDGSNAGATSGFVIVAANCTVRGLVINRFQRVGIFINGTGASGSASGNLIQGNFIGTDVTGRTRLGNGRTGVQIQEAPNNTVGGTQVGEGNVISGNDQAGVFIVRAGAIGNVVQGNFIGTDVTGSTELGNGLDGVAIFDAPDNTIGGAQPGEGNVISGNDRNGIFILGTEASGNSVQGNFIGTDLTGSADLGNASVGVAIQDAPDNSIGGSRAGERNVISGNDADGISITGTAASGNVVQGNFIGTHATGTADLGNALVGVRIQDAPDNTIGGSQAGEANVISGNDAAGVLIDRAAASRNMVQGNFIGTDVTGSADLGNAFPGVSIINAPNNTVGGSEPGEGNVISGNDQNGIFIDGAEASGNAVQGNFIGTDVTGTADLGNAYSGVTIRDAPNSTVGGSQPGQGNVVSGNDESGIFITGTAASGNAVQGNHIGTDLTGSAALGNVLRGVAIQDAGNNTIGGSQGGEGNTIAFNDSRGVVVGMSLEDTSVSNSIRGNAIYSNGDLGIDLGNDGVTANDDLDADTGPNSLQNFPVISFLTKGSKQITGTLNSLPNEEFTLDFYSNSRVDASRFGEGERYLGAETVLTDGLGEASFDVTFAMEPFLGELITATATNSAGSTSEFSQAVVLSGSEESAVLLDELSKLTADDRASDDQFGFSIAVNGNTIVVGALGDDGLRGSVYVFERNGNESESWAQVAKLAAADDDVGDQFGFSVAFDGDTILVGANGDAGLGLFSGAAYVFELNAEDSRNWKEAAKLTAEDGDAGDQFGFSLALGGDTIIVGAPGDDELQGAAYIFERSAGEDDAWGQVAKLIASDGAANDQFGITVAMDGDTIAVGALGGDELGGTVYIFERSTGESDDWEQAVKLIPSDRARNDQFGASIGMDGDIFVAGAPGGSLFRGAAYVFKRRAGEADTWGQVAKLIAVDGVLFDQFGSAVAIDGNTIVVGARVDDFLRGSAYIFERNSGGADNWGPAAKLTARDGSANDQFGVSVAVDGNTIVAGAAEDDELRGSAYVFGKIESAFISLPDANLKDVIREARQVFFRELTEADLAALTTLSAFGSGITDITGLEKANNLTFLDLDDNQIEDLSTLSALDDLESLFVTNNRIAGLGPLSELTNLTVLSAGANEIADITPLSDLASLTNISLEGNAITDVSPLSSLTNVTHLNLDQNQVTDLSPLGTLTNLIFLSLDENQLTDLNGIGSQTQLTELWLERNGISDLDPLGSLSNLALLYLGGNKIADLTPLTDLTELTTLWLNGNRIANLDSLSGLTDLIFLDLGQNEVANLGPLSNLTNLVELGLNENQVADLNPLADLTGLAKVWVDQNRIRDLSPLGSLTNLTFLSLDENQLTDLNGIGSQTQLIELWLERNGISDLDPLSSLSDLAFLFLGRNEITDLSPLSGLTNLANLNLNENRITDVDPLSGLTNLTFLGLEHNQIADVSPLASLSSLAVLDLQDNLFSTDESSPAVAVFAQLEAGGTAVNYSIASGARAAFDDAVELGEGWWFSDWFGPLNISFFPWIFHPTHSWMFVPQESTMEEIFLYDLNAEGWLFTESAIYPSMYSFGRNAWIFYFAETFGPRQFVDLDSGEFFSIP